jgi:hypothetical protein
MSTETKSGSKIAGFLVLAVVAAGAMWGWNHWTSTDTKIGPNEERVDVIVEWSPTPRDKPVFYALLLDDTPVESGELLRSPFQRTLVVSRGTVVKVGGQQLVTGTLRCKARVYSTGKEMREDIYVAGAVRCMAVTS